MNIDHALNEILGELVGDSTPKSSVAASKGISKLKKNYYRPLSQILICI